MVPCGLASTSSKYRQTRPLLNKTDTRHRQGSFQFSTGICRMVVMVSYCCYFQNPSILQNDFTTRYDLVLYSGGNEFMSRSLEWTYKIKKQKEAKSDPWKTPIGTSYIHLQRHVLKVGKIIHLNWRSVLRLLSEMLVETSVPPYLRDLPLPIPIWGVRGWDNASPLSLNL